MKRLLYMAACMLLALTACRKEILDTVYEGSNQKTEFSLQATLDNLEVDTDLASADPDTKAVANAVVRLNWNAGDKLSAINLTTGKALGGDLSAQQSGASSRFSGTLIGAINPGDRIAFLYPSQGYTEEQVFKGATIDFSEQDGTSAVPLAVYGVESVDGNGVQNLEIEFSYLMSYFQINLTDLVESESIDFIRFPDMGAVTTLTINDGRNGFVSTPRDATITVSNKGLASNDKGAKAVYLSGFASPAKPSRRAVEVATSNMALGTTWTSSSLGVGRYYTTIVTDFNGITTFADENFKNYCVSNFDTDGDGEISLDEARAVTSMSFNSDNIESVAGIRYFNNLERLTIVGSGAKWSNDGRMYSASGSGQLLNELPVIIGTSATGRIKSIDLSGLSRLSALSVSNNILEELNLAGCTGLVDVRVVFSRLTSIDVSQNTALNSLYLCNSQLASLDVTKNTALTVLNCYGNRLASLDVSGNTALTNLFCYNNLLTSLDVSKNTALTELDCSSNQLVALDVSKNTALGTLYCSANQLMGLDVSKNTALGTLYCDSNQLTNLDVSKNTALVFLSCSNNLLTSLDVSRNTRIMNLYCSQNQLADIDVSKNTALRSLDCSANQLTSLDLSKNTALNYLYCNNNQLTGLDLSKNAALNFLYCRNNQLTSLDVSKTNLGNSTSTYPLYCSPMPSLKTLTLAEGWRINGINSGRDEAFIPQGTEIAYASIWRDLGMASYTDDFLAGMFGLENATYEVAVQESEVTPGKYRLINPYGEAYPYNEPGDWDDSENYYMIIDASDPANVKIPEFNPGLNWGYDLVFMSYNIYSSSAEGGKLENGVITFPERRLVISVDGGLYFANTNSAFRLVLPGSSSRSAVSSTPKKHIASRAIEAHEASKNILPKDKDR